MALKMTCAAESSVKLVEIARTAKDWGKRLSHGCRLSSFMLGFSWVWWAEGRA